MSTEQTDEETATFEEITEMMQQVAMSDNRIDVSIGAEGITVSMHTNELTFNELKKEVMDMLKSLSNQKQDKTHDVNLR